MVYSKFYTYNNFKEQKFIQNNFTLPSGKITSKLLKNYTIGILTGKNKEMGEEGA